MKKLGNPIGTIGIFKPIYLEVGQVDERDGLYCTVKEASFYTDSQGEYGELVVEFSSSMERLIIGIDEFMVL